MIGKVAEHPAANGSHDEPERKQQRGVQLLDDGIGAGEERAGEVKRKSRVRVEVVPLHEVADRTDEDGLDAAAYVRQVDVILARQDDGVLHDYGSSDVRYAEIESMSSSLSLATTGFINAAAAPFRAPDWKSNICRNV